MIDQIQGTQVQSPTHQGPYLIVGLGNPGRQFEHNRHNVGFMLLNYLAKKLDESFRHVQSKALVTKTTFQGEKLILAKPQTFMNDSGAAVSSLARFYKIPPSNVLVAFDDIDLPLGTLRLRPSGGSAGQKGLQSIIARLGTEEFPRLRIGTSRPPGKKDAAEYVLQDFPAEEQDLLDSTLNRGVEAVLTFVQYGIDRAMNMFNG